MGSRGKWILYPITLLFAAVVLILLFFNWQAGRRETMSSAEAAPPTGRFVTADDTRIFLQETGPASGVPIVLVHGTGAWSEIWRDTMTALGDAGFHAIAIDVPPFGFSDKPEGAAAYGRDRQAKRIIGVLDALGIERALLVGHSVGAQPTIKAALLAPDRVQKLILVDPALGFQKNPDEDPRFEQNDPSSLTRIFFAMKPLRNAVLSTYGTNPLSTKALFSTFVSRKAAVTDARVRMLQRPLFVENATSAYGDWLEAFALSQDPSLASDFTNFKSLTMPVLLVWGRTDDVTPLWQGERLSEMLPHSTLSVIDEVGHIPYIENPEGFNDVLLRFITENE